MEFLVAKKKEKVGYFGKDDRDVCAYVKCRKM